jgi:hypothetical protein
MVTLVLARKFGVGKFHKPVGFTGNETWSWTFTHKKCSRDPVIMASGQITAKVWPLSWLLASLSAYLPKGLKRLATACTIQGKTVNYTCAHMLKEE